MFSTRARAQLAIGLASLTGCAAPTTVERLPITPPAATAKEKATEPNQLSTRDFSGQEVSFAERLRKLNDALEKSNSARAEDLKIMKDTLPPKSK